MTPRIKLTFEDTEIPEISNDCESWKTQLDIYNGITYDGKFSSGSTINGEKHNILFVGQNKNDLLIGRDLIEGLANVRTYTTQKINNPDTLDDSGYTLDEFGFSITEGCPELTEEEKTLLNTPNALQLAAIDGSVSTDFPNIISYRHDFDGELIFTSDYNSSDVDFYLQTGNTECPLISNGVTSADSKTYSYFGYKYKYVLCRYNSIAKNNSEKNIVGSEVIIRLVPVGVFTGERRAEIPMYSDEQRTIAVTTYLENWNLTQDSIQRLHNAGVDVVYSYSPRGNVSPKDFITAVTSMSSTFKKITIGEPVDGISTFGNKYYVVALKKATSGEKGSVNVVRVYPHDMVQEIQPYVPPITPSIEVIPFGTDGVYESISENSGSTFVYQGGNLNIKVKCSDNWTFSFESSGGDTSWIKVNGGSTYHGSRTEIITLSATENASEMDERVVSGVAKTDITYTDDQGHVVPYMSYTIVLQLKKERINYIEAPTTTFSNGGGTLPVNVISTLNDGWTLNLTNQSTDNWIRFAETNSDTVTGVGNSTVYLRADENSGQVQRNAVVSILNPLGGTHELNFSQDYQEVILNVSPLTLTFPKTGGTQYITVDCNGAWTSSKVVGADWITLVNGSDNIMVTANANDGAQRTTQITVSSNGVSKIVTVTQGDGTEKRIETTFSTTATTFLENNNITITINSNTDWKLMKDNSADWFRFPNGQLTCEGTGNASLTCSVTKNTGYQRTCSIQAKAPLLDCIPNPETTVFFQGESDYVFYVNNQSTLLVQSIILTTRDSQTISLEDIYIPPGVGSVSVRMFDTQYDCNQYGLVIMGDTTGINSLSFMGLTATKNEYGVFVANGNFTVQRNGVYVLSA